jgi:hypothetical protein
MWQLGLANQIWFGKFCSLQQFSLAIQFGISVWQFSLVVLFGNSSRQFSSAIHFEFGNSDW